MRKPASAALRPLAPTHLKRQRGLRRAAIYVALALVLSLGTLCVLDRQGPQADVPQGVGLASDCSGPIARWVLALADKQHVSFDSAKARLVTEAAPEISFHVFYAHEGRRRDFEQALEDLGGRNADRVNWHAAAEGAWPWMRDLFLAGSTHSGAPVTQLPIPRPPRVRGPAWQPQDIRAIAHAMGGTSIETGLWIEGGAVLVDDERVIVSRHYVDEAVRRGVAQTAAAVLARMSTLWGKPVVPMSVGAVHASNHCDLVMMPAGDRRMVLASPVLGAALLEKTSIEERRHFEATYGRLAFQAQAGGGGSDSPSLQVIPALLNHSQQPQLHRAYEALRLRVQRLGYACVEVPLLALDPANTGVGLTLSYANTVIDEREGKRVVYMPTYGLPNLDRAATATWRKLGYRVVGVDSLWPALNGGGIHCMSQIYRARSGSTSD